jgi:hypothetical protein
VQREEERALSAIAGVPQPDYETSPEKTLRLLHDKYAKREKNSSASR